MHFVKKLYSKKLKLNSKSNKTINMTGIPVNRKASASNT